MKALKRAMPLFLLIVYTMAVACYFVSKEQNIYFWDYNGYWRYWQSLSQLIYQAPLDALNGILSSVRHDDYNVIPITVTTIFNALPFGSRMSYIISLFVVYVIPTVYLFALLSTYFNPQDKKLNTVLYMALAATFTAFWAPTLRGYPDICGLIFVIAAVLYCAKTNLAERVKIKQAIILGILLWAPFLLRRWYAYTVVSLYFSLPVLNYFLYKNRGIDVESAKRIIFNFFISGVLSCIFALILQWPLLLRIISTDYAYIYSAYQFPFIASFHSLINSVGRMFLPLFIASIALIFFSKSKEKIVFALFCTFNLLFSFFLFTRTQSPGIQHNLPFALWMLLVVAQGISLLLGMIKPKGIKYACLGVTLLFACLIQQHSLFGLKTPDGLNACLPAQTLPLRVQNYPEYLALRDDVLRLSGDGSKVAVLSSSNTLNDDMLSTLTDRKMGERLVFTSQIDLRDGINFNALNARYLIVANPIQTHVRPEGQRVITLPASALLEGKNIGKAFRRLDREYKLSDNVSAWIYEKKRPFTQQELDEFLNLFYPSYPEWKGQYDSGVFYAFLSAQIKKGDIWGEFTVDGNGIIYAHPGENTPTTVLWTLHGVNHLKIKSISTACNTDDTILVEVGGDDLPSEKAEVPKGGEVILDVSYLQGKPSVLSIRKNKSSGCDAINIEGE